MKKEKTELERCLDGVEEFLAKLQVSGFAAIPYSDALKFLYRAKELAKAVDLKTEGGCADG